MVNKSNNAFFFTLEAESTTLQERYGNLINKALNTLQSEIIMENKKISFKICGSLEAKKINKEFRKKDQPTNVLAFPTDDDIFSLPNHLGDILICDELVIKEAVSLGIDFDERFTHLVIHGILHLLGYLHNTESNAYMMETLESKIMSKLGYSDPYLKC